MENKTQEKPVEKTIDQIILEKEQDCSNKINEILKEYNCSLEPTLITNNQGSKFIVEVKYIK
tara:strand:+ start:454 stop:639 length:186 start_codon:yes stop_codon:yes gene_type:complete